MSARIQGASSPVTAFQLLGLPRAELEAVLRHCLKVLIFPMRLHQTLSGMSIVAQKKVAHLVGGGVGEYKHPRKICICGFILNEI